MGCPPRLKPYARIGLDTPVFIYHLEANPAYLPVTQPIFSAIASGQVQSVTSVITLMEINVRPLQLGREDIARKYEALLVNYPHLQIVDIDRAVVRQAARLRASHRLRPADALQAAAALLHGAQVFITNDRTLTRLQPLIDVLILDEF
jgi:predicted nucleic acid-binding protein